MCRWIMVGMLGLTLAGCATGFPGGRTRHLYDYCIAEGRQAAYCEAWAPMQADRLPNLVTGSVIMPVPFPGR
jgi:hypothetical protein